MRSISHLCYAVALDALLDAGSERRYRTRGVILSLDITLSHPTDAVQFVFLQSSSCPRLSVIDTPCHTKGDHSDICIVEHIISWPDRGRISNCLRYETDFDVGIVSPYVNRPNESSM